LVLKSPRFLYPELPNAQPDDFDIASRLSFTLWDSIPDKELLAAAGEGKLRAPEEIDAHANRMLKIAAPKRRSASSSTTGLEMERAEDVSKDTNRLPRLQ
jgi:hypothetical protein